MAVDKEDLNQETGFQEAAVAGFGGPTDPIQTREQNFYSGLSQPETRQLVRPFGLPNWGRVLPSLVCLVLAIAFFTHNPNLGLTTLNWTIRFDVNLVVTLIIVILAIASVGPKAAKNPHILREQSTLASLILLGLAAAFFLFRVLDFGNFNFLVDKIDLSTFLGLVLLVPLIVLAFAGSLTAVIGLVSLFFWWGFNIEDFGLRTVGDLFTSKNGGRLLGALTPPRWEYFTKVIDPLLLTVQTAVAATLIGIAVSLPLSVLAARNTTPHPLIYNLMRFLINTVRAIPPLILALLFIPFVGLGPSAGILGLGIHSISVLTKLYAESFEAVKPAPLEALNAVGANGLKTFRWGVFPQAYPLVASYSIFNWESNVRDSTVVAFVGGGGIGFLLQANLALLDYANVSVMLIVLLVTVALLDRFSDFVRSKII